ncbi:MAG: NADH:flavin oxidoreductase [Myxococcota bacterium]|nr:NADH:flavin oxidoreductase [Myxococcota bacterium]
MTEGRLARLLPIERWPTASEAAAMRWFSALPLGPRTARHRTWVPAMVPWRASPEGDVTPAVVEWYRRLARGRPGVLVVEATGVRDVPSGPLLRISHDRFVPGLSRIVAAVREASDGATLLFIQIIDFLAIKRRVPRETFLRRFATVDDGLRRRLAEATGSCAEAIGALAETEVRDRLLALEDDVLARVLSPRDLESMRRGYRERVTDLHRPHIRELPRILPAAFAAAAERARAAGFDGVELHYAHAYTMASFLSALNDRDDGYGRTRDGRVRLPREVLRAVLDRVGTEMTVGIRMLGDEVVAGGHGIEDAAWFATELAREGAHFISVSKGGKFEDARDPKVGEAIYPYTGPSGHECMPTTRIGPPGPFGRNVPLASAIRRALREAGVETPVVASGGICSPWQAEQILREGHADAVAAARQTLCDPDWFEKIRLGRGHEVRRCFFTNYCEALDQQHREVTCQRWDRFDLASASLKSSDGKRRLVAPDWVP